MKCIAIDDEPIALQILENFCKRLGGLDLQTFSDPVVGMEYVRTCVPDILFLDIEMNGVSGLDIARKLPKNVSLVFTTAYANFAIDGFELNAVDFLHKPFSFARFEKAVNKVAELKKLYAGAGNLQIGRPEITVRAEYQNVRIAVDSIVYIEAMDSYVKIFTDNGKPVITLMSMKLVMDILPGTDFLRIHKSYIIALNRICRYSRYKVTLNFNDIELPVGRAYANDFMSLMSASKIKYQK